MDDTRGNRNKKIRSIKRSFDKDKTELENDKNKKIKDDVKPKDSLQKEKNLSNDRTSNKPLDSSKNKDENLKKKVKTSLREKRHKFQNDKYSHLTVTENENNKR